MKTRNPVRLTLLVIVLLSPLAVARGEWRGGIGVLGDSYSDEYPDAATATIRQYNASIRALASHQPRVAVLDFALFARGSELVDPEAIVVAGRRVVRSSPSDDPDHLFLGDVRHLGTVGQGELAAMVVATINARFAAGVQPLSSVRSSRSSAHQALTVH